MSVSISAMGTSLLAPLPIPVRDGWTGDMNAATVIGVLRTPLETGIIAVAAVIVSVIAYAVLSESGSAPRPGVSVVQKPSAAAAVASSHRPYTIVLAAVGSLIAWRAPPGKVAVLLLPLVVSIALALTRICSTFRTHERGRSLTSVAVATILIVVVVFQQSGVGTP